MSEPLVLILSFIFGACIGSFLNVLIWRLPRGKKITGRSQCPSCKHQLIWVDLIPLFSYLFQRGHCRYCSAKFSARYFIIELLTGILFTFAAWWIDPSTAVTYILLFRAWFVIAICITVFVIDLEHYLILDKIVFPAAGVVLVSNIVLAHLGDGVLSTTLLASLVAAALAGGAFWLLWFISGGRWMGFGDVKYAAFMGLVLSLPEIAVGLFLAFILGSIVGIPLLLVGKKQLTSKLPFGTFLTVSTIITLFWGGLLWQWYFGLIS